MAFSIANFSTAEGMIVSGNGTRNLIDDMDEIAEDISNINKQ